MSDEYPFTQGKLDHGSYALLHAWWDGLQAAHGERAFLRRAGTLTEVMFSPAFHRLLFSLRKAGFRVAESRYVKLAAIAGLAARLKSAGGQRFGRQCGTPGKSTAKPDVAELRMRRLLACEDTEELYTLLRRILALLDNQVNLAYLAAMIWNWRKLDEKHPYDPRRQLALDYYDAAPL